MPFTITGSTEDMVIVDGHHVKGYEYSLVTAIDYRVWLP